MILEHSFRFVARLAKLERVSLADKDDETLFQLLDTCAFCQHVSFRFGYATNKVYLAKSIDFAEQNLKNMHNDCYLRYFNMGDKGAASYNIYRFLDSKTEKDLYNFRYQVFGYENLVVSLDKTTVMNKSQCETRTYNRR